MKNKRKASLLFLTQSALIAALYVVLTTIVPGLSSGVVQFRFSEALCILAVFTQAAVPGLTVGCVLANLINGCAVWDIVFGSLATLIGVIGVRLLRQIPWIAALPYALSNILIIPF
ncbi:MAG: QueT transporter family protein, partial [Clostridia bacterium]|nr:QueT transporter family protein [Clostridia bacterium]